MEKSLKVYSTVTCILFLSFLNACKKTDVPVTLIPTNDVTEVISSDQSGLSAVAVPKNAKIFDVGTGSGDLVIDGNSMKVDGNILVRIKAGTYNNISIKNILAPNGTTVFIKNHGQIRVKEKMSTTNISNVVIAGDNTSGITYGFLFENISFRAITMNGKMEKVTLSNMSFKNVKDYVIAGENSNGKNFAYKGTEATRTNGFKILNCAFDNAGQIIFGGNLNRDSGEDSGLFKDVEIAYNIFRNTETGTVCAFTNVQNYNVHHNVVNNINRLNNNHNGVFYMQGNGKFHDNKLTNYQGNAIRMWLYSRGTTPTTSEIYNNVCYNTRKYSGFEIQAFARNIIQGKTTFANAKVYNNTVGQMNTSKDWEGQLLDLYNFGGTLEYYNNLGFSLHASNGRQPASMINNMSDTRIVKNTNNRYETEKNAVMDVVKFTSRFSGVGASIK